MKATVKIYFVGFDREFKPGETVDLPPDKIEQLNGAGLGIILEVDEVDEVDEVVEWPKHAGGGYYELSNGDKVKGKDAAIAAQTEIDAYVS